MMGRVCWQKKSLAPLQQTAPQHRLGALYSPRASERIFDTAIIGDALHPIGVTCNSSRNDFWEQHKACTVDVIKICYQDRLTMGSSNAPIRPNNFDSS